MAYKQQIELFYVCRQLTRTANSIMRRPEAVLDKLPIRYKLSLIQSADKAFGQLQNVLSQIRDSLARSKD